MYIMFTLRNGKWKLIKGFPGLWNGYDTIVEGQNALHLTHLSDSLMKRDAEELIEKRNAAEVSDELTKRGNYNFDFGAIARYTAKVDDSVLLFDLESKHSDFTDKVKSGSSFILVKLLSFPHRIHSGEVL